MKDQYDTDRGSAQVVGAAVIDTNNDGKKEVVLLDKSSKSSSSSTSTRTASIAPAARSPSARSTSGRACTSADLDGRRSRRPADRRHRSAFHGGWWSPGRKGQRFKALASYESDRHEARLNDLIAGDLNADGHPDIVLIDTAEHFVEIVTYAGQSDLTRAVSFKVFERKSFRGGGDPMEPRDHAVGDAVDGDGRTDLVLIVHDRVLVYRQDAGAKADDSDKKKK